MLALVSIYLALTQVINLRASAKEVPFSKFRNLLTRNYSKRWLLHMSERQSATNPYCNLCCLNITQEGAQKDCGYHTLCRYKKGGSRSNCRGYMAVKFTEGEKYMILDAHNTVRNRVASGSETRGEGGPQPGAANMRRLEWDQELALVAEMWAAQCNPAHDRCRDVERFPVGQNIAMDYASRSNHLGFIQDWFDEVRIFNESSVSAFSAYVHGDVREYTQLVWAESYKLGCARAVFQSDAGPDVVYKEILVCNYGPAGNIPGQPIYVRGVPCSACVRGTKCEAEYPSLCARDSDAEPTPKPQGESLRVRVYAGERDRDDFDPKRNLNGAISVTYTFFLNALLLYTIFYG